MVNSKQFTLALWLLLSSQTSLQRSGCLSLFCLILKRTDQTDVIRPGRPWDVISERRVDVSGSEPTTWGCGKRTSDDLQCCCKHRPRQVDSEQEWAGPRVLCRGNQGTLLGL